MKTEEAIQKLLTGGPRLRPQAYAALHKKIRAHEKVSLPDPTTVDGESRYQLKSLIRFQLLVACDWPALDLAWKASDATEKADALITYGNAVLFYSPILFGHARELVGDDDPEAAYAAYYALQRWLGAHNEPIEEILALLINGMSDKRRSKAEGRTLSGICRGAILLAARSATSGRLKIHAFFLSELGAKSARQRKLAADFLTFEAICHGDGAMLSRLLLHENRSIRTAARNTMATNDIVRATERLTMATRLPLDARGIVADAIVRGMEPKFKEGEAPRVARSQVFDPNPQTRKEALGTLASLSIDVEDIRCAAPHIGLSLFDEIEEVRIKAATAAYYLCDHQWPIPVVQAIAPLIKTASAQFRGTPASELQSALKALTRR